jgi:isopropylmalate/homocitrate/citramalate synthase
MNEPNYFLDSFPQDDFPRYLWTKEPAHLPAQVWTTETTHRDGQQGGLPLSTEQSLEIYDILCKFTNTSGAIRQAEFFAYRDLDKRALQGALERYQSGSPIEPTTWIRAKREDVLLIRSLGVKETGMLASISDYHTFHKFSLGGREGAMKSYLEAVEMALDAGIRPRLHLEDATRADINFVVKFVQAVLEKAASFPISLRPKFRVCDTMGLGLPYEDVELPRSIPRFFRALRNIGLQSEDLEFHPHNDTWMIMPNCLAAIREGCAVINGTCLGKGERTGNAPLEAILLHVIGMGYYQKQKPDFKALNQLAELYSEMGETLPAKYPLYGKDAHRTRAGIHADGLNKFWWMYAPFNVPELLGRPLEVSLTKESGLAGLIFVIKQRLGVTLAKDDPKLLELHRWLLEQFDKGRMTSVEWEELEAVVTAVIEPSAI